MTQRGDIEVLVDAIEEALGQQGQVEFRVGARELSSQGSDTRIVWVPVGGVLSRPVPLSNPRVQPKGIRITPIYQNKLSVVAYIRAPSSIVLFRLWCDVLTACTKVFGSSCHPGAYEINTEGDQSGYVHGDQAALSQAFIWDLLVSQYAPVQVGAAVHGTRTARMKMFDLGYRVDPGA